MSGLHTMVASSVLFLGSDVFHICYYHLERDNCSGGMAWDTLLTRIASYLDYFSQHNAVAVVAVVEDLIFSSSCIGAEA